MTEQNQALATDLIKDLDYYSSRYWLVLLVVDMPMQVGYLTACRCGDRVGGLKKLLDSGATPACFIGITPDDTGTAFEAIFSASANVKAATEYVKYRLPRLQERAKNGELKVMADHIRECRPDLSVNNSWEVVDQDVERMHEIRLEKIAEQRFVLSLEAFQVVQEFEADYMFWIRNFSENKRPPRWWELENLHGKDVMQEAHDAWFSIVMTAMKGYE